MKLFGLIGLFLIGLYGISVGQTFKLECNDKIIPVMEQNDVPLSYNLNTYKYARVTYSGEPLSMEITVSGFEFTNSDWDISPHSYGIKGTKAGNKLTFTVNRTGYLVIRFKKNQDFTKRLAIFIESPEKIPDGELVDIVKKYKVDNTGKKNQTEIIQKALNEISGCGKILFFPKGIYKTFMLNIKSNSRIHLSKNARIIADASDLKSYMAKDAGINRFVFINNAQNIEVTGLGTFDGNGTEILGLNNPELVKKLDGMRLLFILNSKNISFDGIVLKDAARWNTHFVGCENISFLNCKLINNMVNNEYFL